jgi:hypothetical protein
MGDHRPTLLWIGGKYGPRDPWVTDFSASLITTLKLQKTNFAYIFCEASGECMCSEVGFTQLLLARILEQLPKLVLDLPRLFNLRTLQRATTLKQIWEVVEAAIKQLPTYFFLIVDRFDVFQARTRGFEDDEIVLKFLGLASNSAKLRIIITGINKLPPTVQEHKALSWVWLDTSTNPARKSRRKRTHWMDMDLDSSDNSSPVSDNE